MAKNYSRIMRFAFRINESIRINHNHNDHMNSDHIHPTSGNTNYNPYSDGDYIPIEESLNPPDEYCEYCVQQL